MSTVRSMKIERSALMNESFQQFDLFQFHDSQSLGAYNNNENDYFTKFRQSRAIALMNNA